jgi:Trk K+ transport system NAD-binding subunit
MPIAEALRLIGARDLGRLPVVEADNSRKIVGVLRRRDIVRAYDLAIQRKLEADIKHDQVRLETYSRAHILELRVEPGSAADQSKISEVSWPTGTIVATVRRRGRVIVPRGDTTLHARDTLTIVTTPEHQMEVNKLLKPR